MKRKRIPANIPEHILYIGVLVLMQAAYILAGFTGDETWFGFNQLRHLGAEWYAALMLAAIIGIALARRFARRDMLPDLSMLPAYGKTVLSLAVSLFAVALFITFANMDVNRDGLRFATKIMQDVPARGYFANHDELLELYVHSRFWFYTQSWFGWSVLHSYQVLSALSGGFFVYLVLRFARDIPGAGWRFALFIFSCGFMQLFFGTVENYSLVATLLTLYLYSSYRFLNEKTSLVEPSAVLAVAMCFHLLAGWILPSLVYLYVTAMRKRRTKETLAGTGAFAGIIGGVFLAFHFNGLPLRELLYNSHALGHGGDFGSKLAVPSWEYYRDMVNVLFLLCPLVLIVVPLAIHGRILRCPFNVFLLIASSFSIIFLFVWRAQFGAYEDWNLYAPGLIPVGVFLAYNFVKAPPFKLSRTIFALLLATAMLHTYSWIISNHYFPH